MQFISLLQWWSTDNVPFVFFDSARIGRDKAREIMSDRWCTSQVAPKAPPRPPLHVSAQEDAEQQ